MAKKKTPYRPPAPPPVGPRIPTAAGETTRTAPPPVAPPPTPAAPDYAALIAGDPLFQQQKADLSAQGIQSAAERKAATDRALIQFGEVPDFNSTVNGLGLDPSSPMYRMIFGDVDQQTRQSAQDMTDAKQSTVYQLKNAHEMALDSLMSALAARGSVRSGATISGTGLENDNYTGAQFKARSGLLDYLSGVQSAFAQSEQQRQRDLASAAGDATTRQIQEHPYVPPDAPAPPGPPQDFKFPQGPDDRPSGTVTLPKPSIGQQAYGKLNFLPAFH